MKRYRIVTGVDGSPGSQRALEWAIDLAKDLGAEIIAAYVAELPYTLIGMTGFVATPVVDHEWREQLESVFLLEWCRPLEGAGAKYRTVMLEGSPAARLIDLAEAEEADMIVAGSRGRGGFAEAFLGSVTHHLAHHARRPVVVVPPDR